ncbi:MAG: cytochrome c [Flavobacteriales bacterium]
MGFRQVIFLAIALIVASCDYKPKNQGRALYNANCQSCHMEQGQGLGQLYPPIRSSDYVLEHKTELACLIRFGIAGKLDVNGVQYDGEMNGYPRLTETEVSNLVHYILVELNAQENPYTIKEIREQLEECAQ